MTLMSVCIHCHLKLYAKLTAVKLEELARNSDDRHTLVSSLECPISRLDLGDEVSDAIQSVVHLLQTRAALLCN